MKNAVNCTEPDKMCVDFLRNPEHSANDTKKVLLKVLLVSFKTKSLSYVYEGNPKSSDYNKNT